MNELFTKPATELLLTNPTTNLRENPHYGKIIGDVLDRAADLITVRGWVQEVSIDSQRRVCAARAIYEAAHEGLPLAEHVGTACRLGVDGATCEGENLYGFAAREVQATLSAGGVMNWNDQPGRTKKEVIDRLRSVAQECRERDE